MSPFTAQPVAPIGIQPPAFQLATQSVSSPAEPAVLNVVLDGHVVRCFGVLTASTVQLLMVAVDYLFSRGNRQVLLDLTDTTEIDLDAVNLLYLSQLGLPACITLQLLAPDCLRTRLSVCRLDALADDNPAR